MQVLQQWHWPHWCVSLDAWKLGQQTTVWVAHTHQPGTVGVDCNQHIICHLVTHTCIALIDCSHLLSPCLLLSRPWLRTPCTCLIIALWHLSGLPTLPTPCTTVRNALLTPCRVIQVQLDHVTVMKTVAPTASSSAQDSQLPYKNSTARAFKTSKAERQKAA